MSKEFKHPLGETILKKYFEQMTLVDSNIKSFNNFVENQLKNIISENKEIEPTIIPHNIDSFKITLDKIWVGKPEIVEADGSKREIMPQEARLRKITYAGPIMLEVSSH